MIKICKKYHHEIGFLGSLHWGRSHNMLDFEGEDGGIEEDFFPGSGEEFAMFEEDEIQFMVIIFNITDL